MNLARIEGSRKLIRPYHATPGRMPWHETITLTNPKTNWSAACGNTAGGSTPPRLMSSDSGSCTVRPARHNLT